MNKMYPQPKFLETIAKHLDQRIELAASEVGKLLNKIGWNPEIADVIRHFILDTPFPKLSAAAKKSALVDRDAACDKQPTSSRVRWTCRYEAGYVCKWVVRDAHGVSVSENSFQCDALSAARKIAETRGVYPRIIVTPLRATP